MGPTAVGKTKIAVELVECVSSDIISVDSNMVYKGMDIGTAKPSEEELRKAPHRLIDIISVDESYSAGRFRFDALKEIEQILSNNRIPLLVGGTMLYFMVLQKGIARLPEANKAIRERLNKKAEDSGGWSILHSYLKDIDPISAERIHPNDSQRIQRALEVHELTGKTLTQLFTELKVDPLPYKFLNIAILPSSRRILHAHIEKRVDDMLSNGFVDEVKSLKLDHPNAQILTKSIGYSQINQYLEGLLSYEVMREKIITATKQLAKRQISWLNSFSNVEKFSNDDDRIVKNIVDQIERNIVGWS